MLFKARQVSRQGFEGHHAPVFSSRPGQQQRHVTDVDPYVKDTHTGCDLLVCGLLQLDFVSPQPVVHFGLQV